ncbi:M3 family metallopeptidase [Candidatus Dependentiae bacterium]
MNFKKLSFLFVVVLVAGIGLFYSSGCLFSRDKIFDNYRFKIESLQDVVSLFPKSAENIKKQKNKIFKNSKDNLSKIISLDSSDKNFENTALAIDRVMHDLTCLGGILNTVANVHPDKSMRDQALSSSVEIEKFVVDFVYGNRSLYKAFKLYVDNTSKSENLDQVETYFLKNLQDKFERNGLGLSDQDLEKAKELNKKIAVLSSEFQKNINQDNRFILVKDQDLLGLEKDFIQGLKRNKNGQIIVGIDYPTYFNVMKNCANSDTRKKLYTEFLNRGYPKNDSILKDIIKKRDKLAKLLGYKSYADFDCANQMLGSQEKAEKFALNLFEYASKKAKKELDLFLQKLGDKVQLTKDRKLCPWDSFYLSTLYKKKYFDLDDNKIAEYLPMEKVLDTLMVISRKFFDLNLKELSSKGLWHKDVKVFEVNRKSDDFVLGYLILDLYPRKDKFPHACEIPSFHALIDKQGKRGSAVVSIVANLPKATKTKPSLLKLNNVRTLFHEFGHALHEILGAAKISSFSGAQTKTDFVEVPSQLMEMFIAEPEVLKMMSCHYKTSNTFGDDLITKILELNNLSYGHYVQSQLYYAMISLDMFKEGEDKSPKEIVQALHKKMLKQVEYADFTNLHTTFIHLTAYGAKYYSYMFSRVLVLDIFDYIKTNGLLDPKVGQKYVNDILSKGASVDPNVLISTFLGRETNNKAFIKYYGFA